MTRARPPQVLAATPAGRSLLFHLEAGEGVPRHAHPGARVVLAVLNGELHRTTAAGPRVLAAAEVLVHDGNEPLVLEATRPGTRVLVTLLGE